jgi:4-hydroxyphenylacetate 3-monooxygenase/4-hydroxybutyryl-CoA dehydratase/vinylacetyl-CoA-Delta-isomerase
MITGDQYKERIAKLKPNVYQRGKLVDRFDPTILGGINVMASTYDFAYDPEYNGIGVATSHITGEKINRFTHIHQTMEDLLNKQRMTRLYCQEVGGCIQRCMGIDGLNALSIASYEADQAHGTEYYKNFVEFMKKVQAEDLTLVCAQTDVKGNRPWRPGKQKDPDLYLRVVEKRPDGIVVNGAKAPNSCSAYADESSPCRRGTWCPTKGIGPWPFPFPRTGRDHDHQRRLFPPQRKQLDAPYNKLGISHSLTVFDHVFIPWERVFLCGETAQAGKAALLFALYHRHSYCGCKAALSEIFTGATALAAEYNGIGNAQHVRHQLAEMIQIVDLIFAAGIAAAMNFTKAGSGTAIPERITATPDGCWRERPSTASTRPWRHRRRAGGHPAPRGRTSTTPSSAPIWRNTSCATRISRRRTNTGPSGCSRT